MKRKRREEEWKRTLLERGWSPEPFVTNSWLHPGLQFPWTFSTACRLEWEREEGTPDSKSLLGPL